MRKVNNARHAKDERQTRRHQEQRRGSGQPVEGLYEEAGGVYQGVWL
jgi:hypothetical protein